MFEQSKSLRVFVYEQIKKIESSISRRHDVEISHEKSTNIGKILVTFVTDNTEGKITV